MSFLSLLRLSKAILKYFLLILCPRPILRYVRKSIRVFKSDFFNENQILALPKISPLTSFLFRKKRKGFSIKTHVGIPYHSQYGQDKIINERIFGSKRNGFFVDIGANDGITGSNTYFFEKELSWKGVCIEPQPDIFNKLAKNRKSECHNCAVSSKTGTAKFLKVGHADMYLVWLIIWILVIYPG